MEETECMKNFKIIIEYDGTDFNGWQIQAAGRTVQGEIEKALFQMTRKPVRIAGSGRTDAGVHALAQVAAFQCETRLGPGAFFSGLNSLLPDDIAILSCEQVDDRFHPRFDATGKTYIYRIRNCGVPAAVGRNHFWHIKKPLDIGAMDAAMQHIIGTHDFKAFENTGSPRSHTVRTIYDASITADASDLKCRSRVLPDDESMIAIRITADGFLRYMVRNIVGTLVDVGRSKITPEEFAAIKENKDRSRASATAPPQGLFLQRVHYRF
ncbi:MAG: tRNA pseudouridine(38-40) synthase TruA [Thermodesulfobacteriota bacterium]